ncbi:hypothetical protein [Egbenema bharatensis]|uniref:hypothetical protein n=1 Tax=Egbenema bharatensis TaxID=3463334 RepID=UPI003A838328
MPKTTEDLATELCVSARQVLNYKSAVEAHLQRPITFRQGKQHFYHDKYVPLVVMYAKGEPLPPVEEQTTLSPANPFHLEEESRGGGRIVLQTEVLSAPQPIDLVPVQLRTVDTAALDTTTDQNWERLDTFKQNIRSKVLSEAEAFGNELAAEVKHLVSRKVAGAYREVIR